MLKVNFFDLELGQEIPPVTVNFSRDSLVRYAGASGDFNPIHYRDDIANSVGLPGVLAHGMLTMGAAVQHIIDWVGDPAAVVDYQVRFTRPVVVDPNHGAEVKFGSKIVELDHQQNRVKLEISAVYADKTVLGKAFVWLKVN